MKRTWCVWAVVLLVVLPLRLYSVFFLVDPQTGFYTDGGKMAGIAAAAAAVGILALLVLGRKEAAKYPYAALRSSAAAAIAVLAGLFAAGAPFMTFAQNLLSNGKPDTMDAVLALTGVLAAVAFFAAAYDFGTGAGFLRKHPLIALFPTIWGCLFFISLFITYASTVNRFDNIYHTFTVIFLLLFLFSQAKLLSGMDENAVRLAVPFGFSASVMALTDAVPNLALFFSGKKMLGSFEVGVQGTNLVIAAYILTCLAVMCRRSEASSIVKMAPAEEDEDSISAEGGETEQPKPQESSSTAAAAAAEKAAVQPEVSASAEEPLERSAENPDAEYLSFLQDVYQGQEEFREKEQNFPDKMEPSKS